MSSVVTNRGKKLLLNIAGRGLTAPTKWRAILITAAAVPTVDFNTVAEVTEIAAGNGYTSGGIDVERSAVGWDTLTEDDSSDYAKLLAKDLGWTPSGGAIPGSGSAARGICIIDDNATLNNAEILAFIDFGGGFTFPDGTPFTIEDAEIRLT